MNDFYEDLLLLPDNDFIPPEEFIDILITSILKSDAQGSPMSPFLPQTFPTYWNSAKSTKSAG